MKRFLLWTAGIFLALILIFCALSWRELLFMMGHKDYAEREPLGRVVTPDMMVQTRSGDELPLATILQGSNIVMVYSEKCWICKAALADVRERLKPGAAGSPAFIVISDDAAFPNPLLDESLQKIAQPLLSLSGFGPFASRITPRFYRMQGSTIVDTIFGNNEQRLTEWLQQTGLQKEIPPAP